MTRNRAIRVTVLATLVAAVLASTQPASAATCQGKTVTMSGTSGDDQLLGTSGADVIAGNDGNDVIKGLGGNDTICAGPGNDGVNGGPGNDAIQGGDGYDFIVAGPDNDTIEGGNDSDAVYGSAGTDTLYGGVFANGTHTDTQQDYLAGGNNPSGAPDVIVGVIDEIHPDKHQPTAATACPPQFAWKFGTYAPSRLTLNGVVLCHIAVGTVVSWHTPATNDGDGKFDLVVNGSRLHLVEFMPRDKGYLPSLASYAGQTVRVLGAWTTDNHGNDEVHPVFAIDVNNDGVWDNYSGPQNAGSPANLRVLPDTNPESRRFCWDENGDPCMPWSPSGETFH